MVNLVVYLAFVLIAVSVVLDFRAYHRQERAILGSDRSLVETGSMAAFFVGYYLVLRLQLSAVAVEGTARALLVIGGLVLVVVGVVFNLWGRVVLGSSWANQIRVYEGQGLLTSGPFAVIRHPLYASLIWIFVGCAAIYANPLALALALGVFLPMMYVRARKEDALLAQSFGQPFEDYRLATGMFLPKVWR